MLPYNIRYKNDTEAGDDVMLRSLRSFLLITLIALVAALPVHAASTRAADSEDSDSSTALILETCSIKNLEADVPLNPMIQLDFNKNVVNIAVAQNNIACFHLIDENRDSVAIKLIFPDDQLQQEVKRNIFITPEAELEPESTYTLIVDQTLMAKNGSYLNKAYQYTFTTGASSSVESNTLLDQLEDNLVIYTSDLLPNEAPSSALQAAAQGASGSEESAESAIGLETLSYIIIIIAALFVIVLTVLQVLERRRVNPNP